MFCTLCSNIKIPYISKNDLFFWHPSEGSSSAIMDQIRASCLILYHISPRLPLLFFPFSPTTSLTRSQLSTCSNSLCAKPACQLFDNAPTFHQFIRQPDKCLQTSQIECSRIEREKIPGIFHNSAAICWKWIRRPCSQLHEISSDSSFLYRPIALLKLFVFLHTKINYRNKFCFLEAYF